jgi:hypothetical protein
MKTEIEKMENSFEKSLDAYCFLVEAGDHEKAEEECFRAGELFDALEKLKKTKTSEVRSEAFLKAVLDFTRVDLVAAE